MLRNAPPALAVALMTVACTGTGAIAGIALDVGRKLLVGTASDNFGSQYSSQVEKLISTLVPKGGEASVASPQAAESEAPPAAVHEPLKLSLASSPASPSSEVAPSAATTAPVDAGQPPETAALPEPASPATIELEVTLLREVVLGGRPVPVAVQDGDVLRDGVGRGEPGDNLKLRFSTNVDCHVYAFWVDATAWVTPVFPEGPAGRYGNPVRAGEARTLPQGSDWFFLDDYRGVETVYVVASHEPLHDLENALEEFIGLERAFLSESQVATVAAPSEILRGVAGVRPGAAAPVQTSDGAVHDVASQLFAGQLAGGDLVVTRWFRHE